MDKIESSADLIGRFILDTTLDTFWEIKEIIPAGTASTDLGETMVALNWRTNETSCILFVEDIGDDYLLAPKDYPLERIRAYCDAANKESKAQAITLEIFQEICCLQ